jgi:hypothetical protein
MRRRARVATGGGILVAVCVAAVAALNFPTGAVARGTSKPVELPHELQQTVFWMCLPGLQPGFDDVGSDEDGVDAEQGFFFSSRGSGAALSVQISSAGDWSVSVNRTGAVMHNERPSADQTQMISIASAVIPAAKSLYDCLAPYRFASTDLEPPTSSAQLLQLYRYDTNVLWPCLTSHGVEVGEPPSRDQFVTSRSARSADPFAARTLTSKTLPHLIPALQACPLRPAYLG